ncbi:hypothetical protein HpHA157_07000 [Helicobacter pylori]
MEYLNNKGYTPSNLKGYTLSNKIFYYKSKAPKTKKIFIVKNSLLDSGLLNINPNLKSYLKDSRYPNLKSYLINVDFIREDFISDNTKYYNRIVLEFEYALKEEYKQCLIELAPIKYNNNLSYSTKEENQFKKESLTPLILKAFEHNHINVKHREKELEILFFENKQELYNSIN